MDETHYCQSHRVCKCGNDNQDDFYWSKRTNNFGKRYAIKSALCKKCHNKRTFTNLQRRRPSFILASSREADKRRELANNLTREFIEEQVAKPCVYCGNTEMLMTLDRVDNTKGHLQDNVVPACVRCNITRRDMPYEAWLEVAKGMRRALELGLFGEWVGARLSSSSGTARK